VIKGITDIKEGEKKKELEKLEREGGSRLSFKVEPVVEVTPVVVEKLQSPMKKSLAS